MSSLDAVYPLSPPLGTHTRQDKHRFPLIICRYAATGSPSCVLALQR